MGFDVRISPDEITIALRGWDRILNWRRQVVVDRSAISRARSVARSALEDRVDHRSSGLGTHNGAKRPNRRRVGTMLGRGVSGTQFWATPAGDGATPLLVLDLRGSEFARVVLAVDDPEAEAATLSAG